MTKFTTGIVLIGATALTLGFSASATPVQAKSNAYTWSTSQTNARLYYTNTNKNAYIWNSNHTKKLHNLKNYPYSTWFVTQSFAKKYNGKTRVYYKVSNYGGKVSGNVWRGYLTPAKSSPVNAFDSDSDYLSYLQTSKSQKLSRALLSKLSGVDVNVKLSQEAAANDISSFKNVINLGTMRGDFGSYSRFGKKSLMEYFGLTTGGTASTRANAMIKVLTANGYSPSKINSLNGYKLGIVINDGTTYTASSTGYPSSLGSMQNSFTLVLAQAK